MNRVDEVANEPLSVHVNKLRKRNLKRILFLLTSTTLHIVVQNGGNSSLCVILYLTLHLPGPIKTRDGGIFGRKNQW